MEAFRNGTQCVSIVRKNIKILIKRYRNLIYLQLLDAIRLYGIGLRKNYQGTGSQLKKFNFS